MQLRAILSLLRLSGRGYTDGAVNALSAARRLAASRGHPSVTPEHLLAGMAASTYRPTRSLLGRLGIDSQAHAAEILELVGPDAPRDPSRRLDFGPEFRGLLADAQELARGRGRPYVGTEHLVLSLLSGPDCPAADALRRLGASAEAIRAIEAGDAP